MHEDYLSVLKAENAELGYGKVTGSRVNLRSGASTSHKIVATATKGEKCYIIGINNGWYKVIYGSNICYIRSDYLELTEFPYENQDSPNSPKFFRLGKSTGVAPSAAALNGTSGNTSSGNTSTGNTGSSATTASGQAIVNKAKQYLGTPYVYGGASPSGFDCSGFVYYVLKSLGYSPYRTPADQYNQGTYVSKGNLQPGDIVFFHGTYASGISHVGIYAGNGQFIHAPNSRSVVSYSDLSTGYWANHYYGAKRMG
jgi:cell wall-associated NlpC family hydrolase